MEGYTKLADGTLVPHPVDTQVSNWGESLSLEIIFKNEDCIIFLPNKDRLKAGCATLLKFAIFRELENHFSLCRWDNTGGWVKITSEVLGGMEHAKHIYLPVTKYFI